MQILLKESGFVIRRATTEKYANEKFEPNHELIHASFTKLDKLKKYIYIWIYIMLNRK